MKQVSLTFTVILAATTIGFFGACNFDTGLTSSTPVMTSDIPSVPIVESLTPPVQPIEPDPPNSGEITATKPKANGNKVSSTFENGTNQNELILLCSYETDGNILNDDIQYLVDEKKFRLPANEKKTLKAKIGCVWQADAVVAQGPDECPKTTRYSDDWGQMGFDLLEANNDRRDCPVTCEDINASIQAEPKTALINLWTACFGVNPDIPGQPSINWGDGIIEEVDFNYGRGFGCVEHDYEYHGPSYEIIEAKFIFISDQGRVRCTDTEEIILFHE